MRTLLNIAGTFGVMVLAGCGGPDGTLDPMVDSSPDAPDAAAADAAVADAAVADAAATDAAVVDGGVTDAAVSDAAVSDAAVSDAAVSDAAVSDAAVDAGVADAAADAGCVAATTRPCAMGSDIGECRAGTELCSGGVWLACEGRIESAAEACDDLDNNCDGVVDEGCCGNGVVDTPETCDSAIASGELGACPDTCDDEIECTTDESVGVDCQAECTHIANDVCRSGDVSIALNGTRSCTGSGPPDLAYDGEVALTLTPEAGGVLATGTCTVWPESIGPGTGSSAVIPFTRVLSAPGYSATATRTVSGGVFRCQVTLSGSRVSARWEWDFSRCCTYRCGGSATGSASAPPLIEP